MNIDILEHLYLPGQLLHLLGLLLEPVLEVCLLPPELPGLLLVGGVAAQLLQLPQQALDLTLLRLYIQP